ncbi:hypothetical protein DL766_005778 [Monosporascus sp. MC13-8B]|uniref:Anaphase-promoting complex subunit 4 WD40 domain-containing protein n=1 Tax=Monosporascus cannonballus TaxID=155416 RepID=A0ABY0HES5_9PEZI|nr:hypothetical protein DL763_006407 [Monosporascus cannonballus]RYO91790.1 hypothetical protein DL762_002009 [Monosporascus cannonballus]RYP28625.1 hypothetical protein DL766_005778 [Monosporascus sp. MC13-8B]
MYNLTCAEAYRPPIREEVYVLDIIPLASGPVTISSDQELCAFDLAGGLGRGPAKSWRTSHGNVTCARGFDLGAGGTVVCTAGEDGCVAMWDLRLDGQQAQVARLSGAWPENCGRFSCMNILVLIGDVRSTPTPRHQYKEVHSDDITELNFHPTDPNILLTGSTDGLVNVCDTRITDEDEVVIQAFNHDASIHHAAFLNDTEVYAISHDEKLALYDMAEGCEKGTATTDFGDMRQMLGCQYVANVFAKANGAGAVVGAGAHDQQKFELVHLAKGGSGSSWALDRANSVGLPGAHGTEIVRSFCFYDEAGIVFTAGEDGFIKAWR